MQFFDVVSLSSAKKIIQSYLKKDIILIDTLNALGYINAKDLYSVEDLPLFNRSTVDGYAVNARDTEGSSEGMPAMLEIVGNIEIGKENKIILKPNQACYVPTGGMLPINANGMVMIEVTEKFDSTLLVKKPICVNENVNLIGSDISKNELLLEKEKKLNSKNISLLIANGITQIYVYKKPSVSILSSGDELIRPEDALTIGKVRDTNSCILDTLSTENNIMVYYKVILKDNFDDIISAINFATTISDIVLISGGSSVGESDFTYKAIANLGKILFKGISVKPGKPTIGGAVNGKLVLGLPGHPFACYMLYKLLITDSFNDLKPIYAKAFENFPSNPGKSTIVLVNFITIDNVLFAKPLYTKSAYMSILNQADGYCILDEKTEGVYKNQAIEVFCL